MTQKVKITKKVQPCEKEEKKRSKTNNMHEIYAVDRSIESIWKC